MRGKVYLVGAGPGDTGLLTMKAVECLKQAQTIIYDALVNPEILFLANENAEKLYVGKKAGKHTLPQSEINQLLIDRAKEGKIVVRLKGGDPFIFGRGGEEAEFLAEKGIEFEVVPGISSAIAVPAYAGIPLTHRKYTSTLTIVTGHEDVTLNKPDSLWQKIAKLGGTIVILMGASNLTQIVRELVNNGLNSQTPVAVISWGTLPEQETVVTTLNDIGEKTKRINPPAVIVIGEVVNLRQKLNWFEKKRNTLLPLSGKRILVTRTREQASKLTELLKEYGAWVIEFPVIKIAPPTNYKKLDRAINKITDYDWLVFTSSNGVQYFFNRLKEIGQDIRELKGIKIAAIGPETKKVLEGLGLAVDFQPQEEFTQEGLLEGFKKIGAKREVKGVKKVLVPRSASAREVLIEGLKQMGAEVDEVTAYRTITGENNEAYLKGLLLHKAIDIITFTSSSTVTNFCSLFKEEERVRLLDKVKFACIGPITAQKAQEMGLKADIIAKEYTIKGLVEAILIMKMCKQGEVENRENCRD
ncbi:MAG: uroporphyrinogen-III C-methyltransferase [bacterium]|nr:uroporphyrinogen-III C-methyltransferase [bacterium]